MRWLGGVFKRCNLEGPAALDSSVFKLHDGYVRACRRRSRFFGHVDDSVRFSPTGGVRPTLLETLHHCSPACLSRLLCPGLSERLSCRGGFQLRLRHKSGCVARGLDFHNKVLAEKYALDRARVWGRGVALICSRFVISINNLSEL